VLFSGLLLCCAVAQAQVRNYDAMIAAGELKVAVYKDFAPYSFQDHGQPRGVDVELAQALAKALGCAPDTDLGAGREKLDDDLRDYIWRGSPLHKQQLADLMMRVPYDRDYAQKRNELGELENGHVVMFGPYQNEQWQVAYDRRRLDKVGQCRGVRAAPDRRRSRQRAVVLPDLGVQRHARCQDPPLPRRAPGVCGDEGR
jgi:ABC-type amino acid transport substrate-binding protein